MLIRPGHFSLEQLQAVHHGAVALQIDASADAAIAASAAVVQRAAAGSAPVYGVNTGFGKLASTRISEADLATLQLNLIRSHSVGVGAALAPEIVRLVLACKAASLARGASGVRPLVIDTLLAVHNAGLVPYVPSQGSVGASGDLAPLAHMTLALCAPRLTFISHGILERGDANWLDHQGSFMASIASRPPIFSSSCRAASRGSFSPDSEFSDLGFRVVLAPGR